MILDVRAKLWCSRTSARCEDVVVWRLGVSNVMQPRWASCKLSRRYSADLHCIEDSQLSAPDVPNVALHRRSRGP